MPKKQPIGVFDSGIGGITVLNALIDLLPNEDFIYVGDTLNVPYGTKSPTEIASLVTDVGKYLLSQNVKAIVIACNTATANSNELKKLTNIPILGVVEPTLMQGLSYSQTKGIVVLATEATIKSNIYFDDLTAANKAVYQLPCPELVKLVENGEIGTKKSYDVVSKLFRNYQNIDYDTLILGCTHLPLLKDEIFSAIGKKNIVESGVATAVALKVLLADSDLLNQQKNTGTTIINTTKDAAKMKSLITWFTKKYQGIYEITL